ncbi:MAG: acyl carrier protein [Bacteroides sp.]|jgi:acyl carrier protein|nr:acyl carrier protein [Bacteroides sp.]MCI1680932.1 acyl carrier protein [Bacteroides sp.]
METTEILNELNRIFNRVLKVENIILSDETTAQDVDGWTSLTNMILINEIEKQFNVRFTFRDIMKLKSVGDICSAIQNKMK